MAGGSRRVPLGLRHREHQQLLGGGDGREGDGTETMKETSDGSEAQVSGFEHMEGPRTFVEPRAIRGRFVEWWASSKSK